jgi:tetratricopeptide (TPR) repeat protein
MSLDIIEKSRIYIQEGQFEKAQIVLRRALNENPNHAKAVELFGDLAVKLGKSDDAISRYERASAIYSSNKNYIEAILCIEKILKIDRTKNEFISRIANLYKSAGFPNVTIKKLLEFCSETLESREETTFISGLKEIITLQPKNLALRLSFIKILLSLNRSQEAEDELNTLRPLAEEAQDEHILNEIAKLSPQYDGGDEELDPKSRIELGKLLYEIGSKDEALVEFHKAVDDLIRDQDNDEAMEVLNHIIEIDPDNAEAKKKLDELKPEQAYIEEIPTEKQSEEIVGEASTVAAESEAKEPTAEEVVPEPTVVEETSTEEPAEEIPSTEVAETTPEGPQEKAAQEGVEFLKELSDEVEGFVAATDDGTSDQDQVEDIPPLEGQIADIEFLLKEAEEKPAVPSFEVTQAFDDFRRNIIWEPEDVEKMMVFAKKAYGAELYENTLDFIYDMKEHKKLWPHSLELIGGSLIKLGRYNDAIKTIGAAIFSKEISESDKIELRYLFAAAYEGVGDFENALREIEHIMRNKPHYKDVKEIYELLGGKELLETPPPVVPEQEVPSVAPIKQAIADESPPEEKPKEEIDEGYPTIEEPPPEEPEETVSDEKESKKLPEEISEIEDQGEKISFL